MKNIFRLSVALAVAITVAPLVTEAIVGSSIPSDATQTGRSIASKGRSTRQRDHMEYYRAVQIYQDLIKQGYDPETLTKPNINFRSSVIFYTAGRYLKLKPSTADIEESTTETASVPMITAEDLSETQRATLRRFERIGQCPDSLMDYIPGFYELCKKVVLTTDNSQRRQGILDTLIEGKPLPHGASRTPRSTDYRLDQLQELQDQAE